MNVGHCHHCGASFPVPDGGQYGIEATMNTPPAAHAVAWVLISGKGPDFTRKLHECRSGVSTDTPIKEDLPND